MEGEINNFIKVWIAVFVSLCYCYTIGKIIPKGLTRFITILPVVCLFLFLPLNITSIHLGGTTSFFVAWLANFKLLLFAFGKGPLSLDPSITLAHFIAVGCLPIKIQHNPSLNLKEKHQNNSNPSQNYQNGEHPSSKTTKNGSNPPPNLDKKHQNNENPFQNSQNGTHPSPRTTEKGSSPPSNLDQKHQNNKTPSLNTPNGTHPFPKPTKKAQKSALNFTTKALLLAILIRVYDYSDYINPTVILLLYCTHIYFGLEIILAMVAALARTLLGLELEPQFDEPYLSTSLQDFWGRRWNLMVTSILRPSVYDPILHLSCRVHGRKWAPLPATLATFLVSAMMHELIFFYLGRVERTWDATWFFLLHGGCLVVEIALKKILKGRFQLHRLISGPLTVGFVFFTGLRWFVPELVVRCRGDVRAFEEYAAIGAFVKDIGRALTFVNRFNETKA